MERTEYKVKLETKELEVADAAITQAEKAFINSDRSCDGFEVSLWEYTYGDDDDDEVDDDEVTYNECEYSRWFVMVGEQKWEQAEVEKWNIPPTSKKGVWKEIDEKDIIDIGYTEPRFEDDFEDYEDAEKCVEEYIRYIKRH